MGLSVTNRRAETKSKIWLLDQPSLQAAKAKLVSALFLPAHSCSRTCFSSGAGEV